VIKHELRDIGDRYVKERAIIEAARAVKRAHDRNIRSIQPIVSLISLIEAVEALEEVERER
jgi:UDP-3-O-acyl-N-acetylglucosamine deacetylase